MATKEQAYCRICFAGVNRYVSSILRPYELWHDKQLKLSICNCCGTVYQLGTRSLELPIFAPAIHQYREAVANKLINFETDSLGPVRSFIVPIIWSLFQSSDYYLKNKWNTFITTDEPFFISFGIHNLATAIGVPLLLMPPIIAQPEHDKKVESNNGSESHGRLPNLILLTDIYNEQKGDKLNHSQLTVLCIKDNRTDSNKRISLPKVFSVTELNIGHAKTERK
jgi:hypothetical protein